MTTLVLHRRRVPFRVTELHRAANDVPVFVDEFANDNAPAFGGAA